MPHCDQNCKYAHPDKSTGLFWCEKKKIHVSGEIEDCEFYETK
ncbi:MAG: hypothetical protein ACTSV0_08925 [Candidatus Freyarchaeota archaeon]